jgi:sporulation protein YlmC with PRC-barrel domain
MSVLGPDGEKIGKIREVLADSRGRVQSLLVKVDGQKAMLPAANFSGSGNGKAVVSAMGEGQIKRVAQQQDAAAQD